MSQLGTELIPHSITDKGISLTLMYSKTSQQILFVEAGKDFVDLVVGFLTLPIGCVIKLLSENGMVTPKTVGGIANVFKSIQRLEAEETLCTNKKMLTDLKPVYGLGYLATESELGISREGDLESSNSQGYFTCGASSHCSFVSPRYGAKCPRHNKKMTTQCKMMDGCETPTEIPNVDRHGYVKSSSKYFVTDNLEVFPSSNSLALLKKLKVENMSSLDSIDLRVGTDEVLQLLRASLTSANVLSEVFGNSLREAFVVESNHHYNRSGGGSIKSLEKDHAPEDGPLKESIEIARDWGRGLYNALREVQETAFHSSILNYVRDREQRITSALRDLNSPASTENSHSSRSSSGNGTLKQIRKMTDGDYLMPAPCKEMLMLEKQVDKVMARLCHLTSMDPPELDPSVGAGRPKSATVKPPWTMFQNSRVRLPSRVWHP
ncbi:hypothetical protein M758_1G242400 [Ceratodon purpureus]|uniref:Uncharacterized protein n=1 Tax=Ceratodon purpureus TaxID=3225 RepID=A0A8T0JC26_CERPU|nr:hypothetical protein KC19_1G248000 [Ceratodon purpureus]KAG0631306.1 hypothetical protein M758_1G242400 [Ceratodon purpureus]